MPSISSCPECHRDLTIPDLADRRLLLRCPLCDAQFEAERILADSVSFPPSAIVVGEPPLPEPPVDAPRQGWPDAPVDADEGLPALPPTASDLPVATDRTVSSQEPDESFGAEPQRFEPSVSEAGNDTGSVDASHERPDETAEAVLAPPDSVDEPENEYESFGRQAAGMRVAPKARRRSSPLPALAQLLGMALGGVLGLAIGYYVLVWIGGPRADFLELRRKLPHWIMPPVRRHSAVDASTPLSLQDNSRQGTRELDNFLPRPDVAEVKPPAPKMSAGHDAEASTEMATEDTLPTELPAAAAAASTAPRQEKLDFIGKDVDAAERRLSLRESAPFLAAKGDMDAVSRQSQVERFASGTTPLPENYRGPRGFKLRPASELEAALGSAQRALRRPDGKPGLHVTKATFEQLCDLAETVTFVKFDAEDASRDRCRNAAEAILLAIGSDRDKSDIVGRLAGSRFDDSQRQSNGVMMAGIVQQAQQEGDLFAIQLMLFGCGRSVTVISRQPPTPPVAKRDRLLVLGTIVDSPRENLAGYAGELPQVVWGGLPLKLAAAAP